MGADVCTDVLYWYTIAFVIPLFQFYLLEQIKSCAIDTIPTQYLPIHQLFFLVKSVPQKWYNIATLMNVDEEWHFCPEIISHQALLIKLNFSRMHVERRRSGERIVVTHGETAPQNRMRKWCRPGSNLMTLREPFPRWAFPMSSSAYFAHHGTRYS